MKRNLIIIIIILSSILAVTAYLNRGDADARNFSQHQAMVIVKWEDQTKNIFLEDILKLEAHTFSKTQKSSGQDPVDRSYTGATLKDVLTFAEAPFHDFTQINVYAVDGYTVALTMKDALVEDNAYLTYKMDNKWLGTKDEGGRGPYQLVLRQDEFAQNWCKFVMRIELIK